MIRSYFAGGVSDQGTNQKDGVRRVDHICKWVF